MKSMLSSLTGSGAAHSTLLNKLKAKGPVRIFRILIVTAFFASALFIGLKGDTASAQILRTLTNPAELKSTINPARGGDVNFDFDIRYALNLIYNPATGKNDQVNLRSYNGLLVGPTMHVKPGQLLRINLVNNLPKADPSCLPGQPMDSPHCFNSTNLHTHGWHVSPTGNSDNVLLDLAPGVNFDYEYYLPKDHPAGTFWYHSHRHGSTALQVSSGMAGALIVEGHRALKDKATNGIADIDTILKDIAGRPFADKVFMFEQIQYDCGEDTNGNKIWDCTGKVGSIENYDGFGPNGNNSWQGSGRFTMINGMVQPLIETQAGKIERWRLIHGGVRDTINFRITRSSVPFATRQEMIDKLAELQKESPARQAQWLQQNCSVDATNGVRQTEFAVDGLTRKLMSAKEMNILQPGYRSDVLVAFDQPGVYCVLDDPTAPAASINSRPLTKTQSLAAKSVNLNDRRLLSMVFVSGGKPFKGTSPDYIVKQLVAANPDLPPSVLTDLAHFQVPEFVPHADIGPGEVTGHQEMAFAIRFDKNNNVLFQVANEVDPKPDQFFSYDPNRIDRVLTLGGVDEWKLTTRFVSHPFHIHVNPFQIIDILKPDGTSIIDKYGNCVDTDPTTGVADTQYCDQIGIFRDTLFIKENPNADPSGKLPGYTVITRTRYERYIGDFVLHCHILDHEDGGMMQNVRIAPQGGYLEGNPTPTMNMMKHPK